MTSTIWLLSSLAKHLTAASRAGSAWVRVRDRVMVRARVRARDRVRVRARARVRVGGAGRALARPASALSLISLHSPAMMLAEAWVGV